MKQITGNLLDLAEAGHFDVIVHGCNCFCTMGAGIARAIAQRYPEAALADAQTEVGDRSKLGGFTACLAGKTRFLVVNAYTQYGMGGLAVDYAALRSCFKVIAQHTTPEKRIGYPKIGAGLGGGDWSVISKIIDEELFGRDHTLVVLPT